MKRELSYLIQFTQTRKLQLSECLAITFNIKVLKLGSVMDSISDTKKTIPSGTYAGRQLLSIVEGMVELKQFEIDDEVTEMNRLKGITEMIINLDELNNSINLQDGRPSNELLTYHVTDDKDFTRFELQNPQYKNLKTENLLP